jgi:hypothetical protein
MIDESRGVLQFADNRPSLSEVGHQGTLRYREASGFPFPRSGRARPSGAGQRPAAPGSALEVFFYRAAAFPAVLRRPSRFKP